MPMLWVYDTNTYLIHFQRGDRLYMSEYDVYRRQILTYKDGLRTERVNLSLNRRLSQKPQPLS